MFSMTIKMAVFCRRSVKDSDRRLKVNRPLIRYIGTKTEIEVRLLLITRRPARTAKESRLVNRRRCQIRAVLVIKRQKLVTF